MKALHPLEFATVFISSESMCSLSSVLPVIHELVGRLEPTEDDHQSGIKDRKNFTCMQTK